MNSRYKDFYDIFVLSRSFPFDGTALQAAVQETFMTRNTPMENIVAFEEQFITDPLHQRRWAAFAKKKRIAFDVSLDEVLSHIKEFINPLLEALQREKTFTSLWQPDDHRWQ